MTHTTNSHTPRLLVAMCVLLAWQNVATQSRSALASELRFTPMVRAAQEAAPSVVNIHGKKTVRADEGVIGQISTFKHVNGMGSGVVIDERGYVLTNYHVVEGVGRIQVTLDDKREVTAQLVAHDPETDLAIIKLDLAERMKTLKVGTSSDLMQLEPVMAIGNAYGYGHTASHGVISNNMQDHPRTVQVSDEQTYRDLIQTDAAINPGNSGGPLINIDGEMIGINVAVRVGAQGIGFAIPVDKAMEVAARLIRAEQKSPLTHGIVGKTVIKEGVSTFVVESVGQDTPASTAEVQVGDTIAQVNDVIIHRAFDFERALIGLAAGDEVKLVVDRAGETKELAFKATTTQVLAADTNDRVWEVLGIKLANIPADQFVQLGSKYRGGLKVVDVRGGSSAQKRGIQKGDVLVGLHIWETITLQNVTYILNRPDFNDYQPLKFYVLRGGETWFGHLQTQVASR